LITVTEIFCLEKEFDSIGISPDKSGCRQQKFCYYSYVF